MWQRFTERARHVILLAQEEAAKAGVSHVGTEHLLLGLMRQEQSTGARVLAAMGVDFGAARAQVRAAATADRGVSEPKLTPRAKRVLELAADEARLMRLNYIGTEHLLIALTRRVRFERQDSLAEKILNSAGVDVETARAAVVNFLASENAGEPEVGTGEELLRSLEATVAPRFTQRARRVVAMVQEEAAQMGSSWLGTEHLLLGLVRENEGVAAQVLRTMGVDLNTVRAQFEPQGEPVEAPFVQLTPKARRVIELAADEARRMRHNFVGTEHLLLGVLRESDGPAVQVLREAGITTEAARESVLSYLGPDAAAKPGPLPPLRTPISEPPRPAPSTATPPADVAHQQLVARLLEELLRDDFAARTLAECGLNVDAARWRLEKFLDDTKYDSGA